MPNEGDTRGHREIQLTDGIAMLLESQPAFALRFQGVRYDVGNPLGLLKASVALALQREDVGPSDGGVPA